MWTYMLLLMFECACEYKSCFNAHDCTYTVCTYCILWCIRFCSIPKCRHTLYSTVLLLLNLIIIGVSYELWVFRATVPPPPPPVIIESFSLLYKATNEQEAVRASSSKIHSGRLLGHKGLNQVPFS